MIYFDTNKEAYAQKETIEKWGKTYLTECSDEDYVKLQSGELIWNDNKIVINPNYENEKLIQAKENKKAEALLKANEYINNGEALFEFEQGKHIEATDGNIGKLTAYMLGFEKQLYEVVPWVTKEDEIVALEAEDVAEILQGLAAIQGNVWAYDYQSYLAKINEATTAEEVEAIIIDYEDGGCGDEIEVE